MTPRRMLSRLLSKSSSSWPWQCSRCSANIVACATPRCTPAELHIHTLLVHDANTAIRVTQFGDALILLSGIPLLPLSRGGSCCKSSRCHRPRSPHVKHEPKNRGHASCRGDRPKCVELYAAAPPFFRRPINSIAKQGRQDCY